MKWDICALHSQTHRHGLGRRRLRQDFSPLAASRNDGLEHDAVCRGSRGIFRDGISAFAPTPPVNVNDGREVKRQILFFILALCSASRPLGDAKWGWRCASATAWALTKWHGWRRLWISNYKIKSNNRPSVFTRLWKCSVSACSNVHGSAEHKSLSGDKVCIMYFDINRRTRGMKWAAGLSWMPFISLTIAAKRNTCSVLLRLGLSFFLLKAISIIWHFSSRMGENERR